MQTQTKAKEKAGHTPGPWRVAGHTPGAGTLWRDIVTDALPYAPSYICSALEQDAELIASTPELAAELAETKAQRDEAVAALQNLVRCIERDNLHTTQGVKLAQARAAIARAQEGQP